MIENVLNFKDKITLLGAVKATDLLSILSREVPFTVFALKTWYFHTLAIVHLNTLLISSKIIL